MKLLSKENSLVCTTPYLLQIMLLTSMPCTVVYAQSIPSGLDAPIVVLSGPKPLPKKNAKPLVESNSSMTQQVNKKDASTIKPSQAVENNEQVANCQRDQTQTVAPDSGYLDVTVAPRGEPIINEVNLYGTSYKRPIHTLAFTPDGRKIVVADGHGTTLWDINRRQRVGEPLEKSLQICKEELYRACSDASNVTFATVSPDGKIIASIAGHTIRLWGESTGKSIGEPMIWQSSLYGAAFSPNNKILATVGFDYLVRLWDVAGGKPIGSAARGHSNGSSAVAFSPDGRFLATGSSDKTIRLRNSHNGEVIGNALIGHTDSIESIAFTPNSKVLISASKDKTIRRWDVAHGVQIGIPLSGHAASVTAISLEPSSRVLVSASEDRTVRLWNVSTGDQIGEPILRHTGPVLSVAFSPDGRLIAAGTRDGTIRIWDIKVGEQRINATTAACTKLAQ